MMELFSFCANLVILLVFIRGSVQPDIVDIDKLFLSVLEEY